MDLVNGWTVECISTLANVLAVWGVLLNNHRRRRCFVVWMFSNSLTAAIHLYAGLWSLLVRDVLFLALAVHGYIAWRRPQPRKENS